MWARFFDIIRAVVIFANLYALVAIVLRTEITFTRLLLIILFYTAVGVLLFKIIKKEWRLVFLKFDYFGILLPTIFNLFFIINYTFSGALYQEKYPFVLEKIDEVAVSENHASNLGLSTTILLNHNAYQDYYLLRTFPDLQEMVKNNTITYTFADGLFGLKVLKNYEFSRENLTFE